MCGQGNHQVVQVMLVINVQLIFYIITVVIDCGSPGFPVNGNTIVGGTTYNSTVTHLCDEGYILIGDKTRTCHGNGTWSGVFPQCKCKLKLLSSSVHFSISCFYSNIMFKCQCSTKWIS